MEEILCRTCLSGPKETEFVDMVNEMFENESVLEVVTKFASIKLLPNDPLPKVVCCICLEKLQLLHNFRQIIVNSDNILKQKLLDEEISLNTIGSVKLETTSQLDFSNDSQSDLIREEEPLLNCQGEDIINIEDKDNIKCNIHEPRYELKQQKNGRRKYKCRECDKLFKKADHYKVHMTTHTGEKKYACEFCPKRFARSYVLMYHRRVHTGERPYICDICSKRFSSPSNFYTHKKIHSGEKNYKCEICNESFIQLESLKIHVRRMHTGERPFLCEICSSAFRSKSSLLTHKLDMHGEKEACPICNKLYSSRVLKEHIRRHKEKEQGIKRYACDQCGKRFTCSSSRKKHLLIHSGEKPYSCEVCQKCFNQRSALNTHMRIHSEFMPFQCHFCPKYFRYKHHLGSHNNTHHIKMLDDQNSRTKMIGMMMWMMICGSYSSSFHLNSSNPPISSSLG